MKKKLFVCILLIVAIALSSCSLVVKDPVVDAARTVIDVDGNQIIKSKLIQLFNSNYDRQIQFVNTYRNMGMQVKKPTREEILDSTIDALVKAAVKENKIVELKLTDLNDEENKKLEADSNALFESWKSQIKSIRFANTKLEGEELDKAIIEALNSLNLNPDVAKEESKKIILDAKLKDFTVKEISVADEEIKAEYDKLVENDKTRFEANKAAFGEAKLRNSSTYYTPSGYRMVKQILIKFDAEDQTELNKLTSEISTLEAEKKNINSSIAKIEASLSEANIKEEAKKNLEAEKASFNEALATKEATLNEKNTAKSTLLDKAYAKIDSKANEAYTMSKSSKFEELIEKYNEDKGMPQDGYAVSSDSSNLDKAFVDAAMSLKAIGDVSEPAKGIYGYYIVCFTEELKEGAIEFDKVAENIKTSLLTNKQNEFFDTSVQEWQNSSKVQIFKDRIFD